MCTLLHYQAKVITLSGKRSLLHYRLKIITLSVIKFITLSVDVITLSVGYYINGRFYYIIGQLLGEVGAYPHTEACPHTLLFAHRVTSG